MSRLSGVLLAAALIGAASTLAAHAAPLGLTIVKATAGPDRPAGMAVVVIDLDPASTAAFGTFTTENVGRQVALSIGGNVVTSPVIREPILGGRLEVSGMDKEEARRLAQDLTAGAPLSVDIVDGPAE